MTRQADHSPFLLLEHISRAFPEADGDHVVLRDVSLAIERGETVALLGRSGSGKSTLLNLISGIDLPDAGRVLVDGHDLTALDEHERTLFRRQHIGFIYQFFNLIPTLTARENIEFVLELNGVESTGVRDRTVRMMEALEISDRGHLFPAQLSGGEQQRVSIARALIHAPAIVLADEPTGNLDARTGRRILSLLGDSLGQRTSALLLVTHSLEVARLADRLFTLEDGVIEERQSDFAW